MLQNIAKALYFVFLKNVQNILVIRKHTGQRNVEQNAEYFYIIKK